MRQVRWLRRAIQNLGDAAAYVAKDSPDAADEVVERIRAAVTLLADQPDLGRPGRVPGTRELVVPRTSYIVPYRIRDGAIEVLRVLHSASQWPAHF